MRTRAPTLEKKKEKMTSLLDLVQRGRKRIAQVLEEQEQENKRPKRLTELPSGVSRKSDGGSYYATIRARGREKHLGCYDTAGHASAAVEWARALRDKGELYHDTPVPEFPGKVSSYKTRGKIMSPDGEPLPRGVTARKTGFAAMLGPKYLGYFKCVEDAIRVRQRAELAMMAGQGGGEVPF